MSIASLIMKHPFKEGIFNRISKEYRVWARELRLLLKDKHELMGFYALAFTTQALWVAFIKRRLGTFYKNSTSKMGQRSPDETRTVVISLSQRIYLSPLNHYKRNRS